MPLHAILAIPERRKNDMTWNNFNGQTYLKIRPGADVNKIAAKITGVMVNHKQNAVMSLEPLKEMHFETDLPSDSNMEHVNRKTVYIFSVLGVFLLVIACINYVNLTTARASLRAKEVSIRKIVGAGRQSLFIQFILESLLISALS